MNAPLRFIRNTMAQDKQANYKFWRHVTAGIVQSAPVPVRPRRAYLKRNFGSPIAVKFAARVSRWKRETMNWSMMDAIVLHPSYQSIIGMGAPVISLLIDELEREPNHWFPALEAITGENPIDEDDYGDVDRMTGAWLEWAKDNGYRS